MLRENVSNTGTLDTDNFKRALLTHRNTPDRDTGVSPAQVVFGRPIRDFIPIKPGLYQPRQEWLLTRERRELALARRHVVQEKRLAEHTKTLPRLKVTDVVMVQNQTGPHSLKWDRSGMVVEVLPFDQYKIKMDGSGRLSLRNRKFLKPITPFTTGPSRQTTTTTGPSPTGLSPTSLPTTPAPAPAPHQPRIPATPVEEQQQVTGGSRLRLEMQRKMSRLMSSTTPQKIRLTSSTTPRTMRTRCSMALVTSLQTTRRSAPA